MAKRQKPQPLHSCVYCGKTEELGGERFTRDHVLPRVLFNTMDPRMITVLACRECQQEKSYGDVDLRDYVNMHWAGEQHPEAEAQLLKIVSAMLQSRSKLGQAFWNEATKKPLLSKEGLILGEVWEAPAPNENRDMVKTLEYIVRGLYFYETERRLPPTCPVRIEYIETMTQSRAFMELFGNLPNRREPRIKGHVVVWWTWNEINDDPDDPYSTIWLLVFNDNVYFFGTTGRAVQVMERVRNRARQVKD